MTGPAPRPSPSLVVHPAEAGPLPPRVGVHPWRVPAADFKGSALLRFLFLPASDPTPGGALRAVFVEPAVRRVVARFGGEATVSEAALLAHVVASGGPEDDGGRRVVEWYTALREYVVLIVGAEVASLPRVVRAPSADLVLPRVRGSGSSEVLACRRCGAGPGEPGTGLCYPCASDVALILRERGVLDAAWWTLPRLLSCLACRTALPRRGGAAFPRRAPIACSHACLTVLEDVCRRSEVASPADPEPPGEAFVHRVRGELLVRLPADSVGPRSGMSREASAPDLSPEGVRRALVPDTARPSPRRLVEAVFDDPVFTGVLARFGACESVPWEDLRAFVVAAGASGHEGAGRAAAWYGALRALLGTLAPGALNGVPVPGDGPASFVLPPIYVRVGETGKGPCTRCEELPTPPGRELCDECEPFVAHVLYERRLRAAAGLGSSVLAQCAMCAGPLAGNASVACSEPCRMAKDRLRVRVAEAASEDGDSTIPSARRGALLVRPHPPGRAHVRAMRTRVLDRAGAWDALVREHALRIAAERAAVT